MQKLMIIGNLVRDPDTRQTASGQMVCNFTVAVNRRTRGDHPEADYFRVAAWDRLADACQQYLVKGKKVCVVGSVRASAYINKDGEPRGALDVSAQEVHFLSPRGAPQEESDGFIEVEEEVF